MRLALGQVVLIPSRTTTGVSYHVVRTLDGIRCDCPSGRHDRPCHHVAVVDAGVTPADGPAAPTPGLAAARRGRQIWSAGGGR